jgi:hypothetical protein
MTELTSYRIFVLSHAKRYPLSTNSQHWQHWFEDTTARSLGRELHFLHPSAAVHAPSTFRKDNSWPKQHARRLQGAQLVISNKPRSTDCWFLRPLCVRVCVCVCVRARARVCVRVLCAYLVKQPYLVFALKNAKNGYGRNFWKMFCQWYHILTPKHA